MRAQQVGVAGKCAQLHQYMSTWEVPGVLTHTFSRGRTFPENPCDDSQACWALESPFLKTPGLGCGSVVEHPPSMREALGSAQGLTGVLDPPLAWDGNLQEQR